MRLATRLTRLEKLAIPVDFISVIVWLEGDYFERYSEPHSSGGRTLYLHRSESIQEALANQPPNSYCKVYLDDMPGMIKVTTP